MPRVQEDGLAEESSAYQPSDICIIPPNHIVLSLWRPEGVYVPVAPGVLLSILSISLSLTAISWTSRPTCKQPRCLHTTRETHARVKRSANRVCRPSTNNPADGQHETDHQRKVDQQHKEHTHPPPCQGNRLRIPSLSTAWLDLPLICSKEGKLITTRATKKPTPGYKTTTILVSPLQAISHGLSDGTSLTATAHGKL